MKKQKAEKTKLTRIFGLIGRAESGDIFLSRSRLALAPVLQSVAEGCDNDRLFQRHTGIKPEEIHAVRAYACRFGSDPAIPASLPPGQKALLLDENISYALLPSITNLLGPSSHVEAEGLSRQNLSPEHQIHRKQLDRLICKFAVKHEFCALATCDSDFLALRKDRDNPAQHLHIIHFERKSKDGSVEEALFAHRHLLRKIVEERSAGLTSLTY